MSTRTAVVVGAGIGGLTTAIALQQAGVEVTVLERRRSIEETAAGAGVHLWSNALTALHRIGLADRVASIGSPVRLHRYVTWRGRPIGRLGVQELAARVGTPTVGVSRGALHEVLAGALSGDVIRFGQESVGFDQNTKRVQLHLADGQRVEGDVLVGADGIGSVVRRQLHGPAAPRYSGQTAWRAICDFDDERMAPGEMVIYWGRGARILHYRVTKGQLYWLALVKRPERTPDVAGRRHEAVTEIFRGWPTEVQAMIEATAEDDILRTDIRDRDPITHWGRGRVTLLGDAAHPMTPDMAQGAGQAIEDAVSLAAALRRHRFSDEALRDYESRRAERANGLVATSRAVCGMGSLSVAPLCGLRDRVILPTIYATQRFGPARKNLTAVL